MALKAGYKGLKKAFISSIESFMAEISGSLIIKSVGDGLSFDSDTGELSAEGSGGAEIILKDWAQFNNSAYLSLPFPIKATNQIEVGYDVASLKNPESVYGNSIGEAYSQLTWYSNKWNISTGSHAGVFEAGTGLGKHVFIENINGESTYDGVKVADFTGATANGNIWLGSRAQGGAVFAGKLNKFIIRDITDDSKICEILPAEVQLGSGDNVIKIPCLYDKVNKVWYTTCVTSVGDYPTPSKKKSS